MPTIGEQLREARERRGLSLEQVEVATKIHLNQLAALESESFEEFPARAYARSFLREYAEFLGLDPGPMLEELRPEVEESEPGPLMVVPIRPRRSRWVLAAVAMFAVAVAIFSWQMSSGSKPASTPSAGSVHPVKSTSSTPRPTVPTRTQRARFVLVASSGRCWIAVHSGSSSGPALYVGTLEQGDTAHFTRKQLWIRLGAPWNLTVQVNGRSASLPASTVPINVVVTRAGVKMA
jgi:transcriptional regulator with XRE-family HTH domain